jgi:hypothetical protein
MNKEIKKNINIILIGTSSIILWYLVWEVLDKIKAKSPNSILLLLPLALMVQYITAGEVRF